MEKKETKEYKELVEQNERLVQVIANMNNILSYRMQEQTQRLDLLNKYMNNVSRLSVLLYTLYICSIILIGVALIINVFSYLL